MSLSTLPASSELEENVISVTPMEFISESIHDCLHTGNHAILCEALSYSEYRVATDELITEAYLTRNDRVDFLVESIQSSVKTKVIAFLEKCKRVLAGIIEKLKSFAYQLTNRTTQWAQVMEPRIKASKAGPITAECYNWDVKYVSETMPGGLSNVHHIWDGKIQPKVHENAGALARQSSQMLGSKTDAYRKELDDLQTNGHEIAAQAFGVSGSDADSVWAAIVRRAHGGDAEKHERQISAAPMAMLEAVKSSAGWISGLTKTYSTHLASIESFRKSLDAEDPSSAPANEENVQALNDCMKARYDYCIKVTQLCEGIMAKGNSLNIQLIQDMDREFMAILSRFASAK